MSPTATSRDDGTTSLDEIDLLFAAMTRSDEDELSIDWGF